MFKFFSVIDDWINKACDYFSGLGELHLFEEHLGEHLDDIAQERRRQVYKKGWTQKHDDCHGSGELAQLACYYAWPDGSWQERDHVERIMFPQDWLEDGQRGKKCKHDRKKQLVIAGALILAELERLKRKEPKT